MIVRRRGWISWLGGVALSIFVSGIACLPPPTNTGNGGGSGTTSGSSQTSEATASGSATGSTTSAEGRDNGSPCDQHSECASGRCFVIELLGGLCSECMVDGDCDGGGCSLPRVLDNPPMGARCTDGELGQGCMSDAVCEDPLHCVQIIDVPSIIQASSCSECRNDRDCGPNLCSPRYHIMEITGEWVCVESGTVANGEGCDLDGSGDAACLSGICAPADIMGLTQVGICGDCASDEDCTPPQVCQETAATLLTGTVHPAICVDP